MSVQKTIDITQFELIRPLKMRWLLPTDATSIVETTKSKSLRKFLAKADDFCQKNSLTHTIKELSKSEFLEWLPFYEARMREQGYKLFANESWYQNKIDQGCRIYGLFFYKEHELVGSSVFTQLEEMMTINFKASQRLDIFRGRQSLGALIDHYFVVFAKEQGMSIISAGIARNTAGVDNTISYLKYKLRLGYYPVPAENISMLETVPVNTDGWVLFYGLKKEKLGLYLLHSTAMVPEINLNGYNLPLEIQPLLYTQ